METNFELFDYCLKTIAANSAADKKADRDGIISNHQACISIVHNFLKGNVLDEKRRNDLKDVLFQYAVEEFSSNGVFADYKLDNKCPDMVVEDYIDTVFLTGSNSDYSFSVKEAYTGNDGYNIWIATLGLLKEMLKLLSW